MSASNRVLNSPVVIRVKRRKDNHSENEPAIKVFKGEDENDDHIAITSKTTLYQHGEKQNYGHPTKIIFKPEFDTKDGSFQDDSAVKRASKAEYVESRVDNKIDDIVPQNSSTEVTNISDTSKSLVDSSLQETNQVGYVMFLDCQTGKWMKHVSDPSDSSLDSSISASVGNENIPLLSNDISTLNNASLSVQARKTETNAKLKINTGSINRTKSNRMVTIIKGKDGIVQIINNEKIASTSVDKTKQIQPNTSQSSSLKRDSDMTIKHEIDNNDNASDDTLQRILNWETSVSQLESSDESVGDSTHCLESLDETATDEETRQFSEEDKVIWQKLLSQCQFIHPIGVMHGYTKTKEEFLRAKAKYEEISGTAYVVNARNIHKKPTLSGTYDHTVWFEETAHSGRNTIIPYDGVPYTRTMLYTYGCHLGHDRCEKRTNRRATSKSTPKRETTAKKLGCDSLFQVKEVVKFPDYKLVGTNTKRERTRINNEVKNQLHYYCEYGERRFYFLLPSLKSHEPQHTLLEGMSKNPVHPALVEYVEQCFREGDRKLLVVKKKLEHYSKNVLCKDMVDPPHPEDRRFFPEKRFIRNKLFKLKKEYQQEEQHISQADYPLEDADQYDTAQYDVTNDEQKNKAKVQHMRKGCTNVLMELMCLIDYHKDTDMLSELGWVLDKMFDYFFEVNDDAGENAEENGDVNQSSQSKKESDTTLRKYLFKEMQVLQPKTSTIETQTEPVSIVDINPVAPDPEDDNDDYFDLDPESEGQSTQKDCCLKHAGKLPVTIKPRDNSRKPYKAMSPQKYPTEYQIQRLERRRKLEVKNWKEQNEKDMKINAELNKKRKLESEAQRYSVVNQSNKSPLKTVGSITQSKSSKVINVGCLMSNSNPIKGNSAANEGGNMHNQNDHRRESKMQVLASVASVINDQKDKQKLSIIASGNKTVINLKPNSSSTEPSANVSALPQYPIERQDGNISRDIVRESGFVMNQNTQFRLSSSNSKCVERGFDITEVLLNLANREQRVESVKPGGNSPGVRKLCTQSSINETREANSKHDSKVQAQTISMVAEKIVPKQNNPVITQTQSSIRIIPRNKSFDSNQTLTVQDTKTPGRILPKSTSSQSKPHNIASTAIAGAGYDRTSNTNIGSNSHKPMIRRITSPPLSTPVATFKHSSGVVLKLLKSGSSDNT